MRAIDADLLGLTDMEIIMCDGDYKEALKMLIDKIKHAPTIEPQCTGKWKRVSADKYIPSASHVYRCSRCGDINWLISKFCPNCGAKME